MAKINVQNTEVTVINFEAQDYISLTDMAGAKLMKEIIFL